MIDTGCTISFSFLSFPCAVLLRIHGCDVGLPRHTSSNYRELRRWNAAEKRNVPSHGIS